jgi:phage tail protein X
MPTAVLTVPNNFTPIDLLLYRQYKTQNVGLVEQTLDSNRGLADLGVYPPWLTTVNVTPPVPIAKQAPRKIIRLYN